VVRGTRRPGFSCWSFFAHYGLLYQHHCILGLHRPPPLVRDQAAGLRPELIQSVRSLGAGRRALFRYVYLPASLPAILTGVRQSIGTAVAVLYVAELVATRYGLGYYIYYQGSTLLNYPAMYAGIVAMSLLGVLLYVSTDRLEKVLCPWIGK